MIGIISRLRGIFGLGRFLMSIGNVMRVGIYG